MRAVTPGARTQSLVRPAARSGARPSIPATPRPTPPANSTAAGPRRCVARSPEREASSASMHASTPGFARVAANIPPSRHGPRVLPRAASRSRTRDPFRSPGCRKVWQVQRAHLQRRLTARPCAVHEFGRQHRRNAASRRRYAERRAKGLYTDRGQSSQGAARCSPALRVRISARITFAGCRSSPRATPSSNSPPAKTTDLRQQGRGLDVSRFREALT